MRYPLCFLIAAILSACQHPDGQAQTRATVTAIDRTAAAVNTADADNARAQGEVEAIDDKVVRLLNSR